MSKYIDLADQIIEAKPASPNSPYADDVREILGWLDEFASQHPDQVPGRTITESEFDREADRFPGPRLDLRTALINLGFVFLEDRKPTNAEKLEAELEAALHGGAWGETVGWKAIAERLDAAGAKAPKADHE